MGFCLNLHLQMQQCDICLDFVPDLSKHVKDTHGVVCVGCTTALAVFAKPSGLKRHGEKNQPELAAQGLLDSDRCYVYAEQPHLYRVERKKTQALNKEAVQAFKSWAAQCPNAAGYLARAQADWQLIPAPAKPPAAKRPRILTEAHAGPSSIIQQEAPQNVLVDLGLEKLADPGLSLGPGGDNLFTAMNAANLPTVLSSPFHMPSMPQVFLVPQPPPKAVAPPPLKPQPEHLPEPQPAPQPENQLAEKQPPIYNPTPIKDAVSTLFARGAFEFNARERDWAPSSKPVRIALAPFAWPPSNLALLSPAARMEASLFVGRLALYGRRGVAGSWEDAEDARILSDYSFLRLPGTLGAAPVPIRTESGKRILEARQSLYHLVRYGRDLHESPESLNIFNVLSCAINN